MQALPKNSVGSPQIKNRSIQRIDISRKAAASLRGQRGPRGFQGPKGDKGDTGAAGAKGDKGDTGPAGPMVDTLPSGKSLKGQFTIVDHTSGAGSQQFSDNVSFGIPLSAAPVPHYIPPGGVAPAGCAGNAGNPQASPGHLCVFANYAVNVGSVIIWKMADALTPNAASRFGAAVVAYANNASTDNSTVELGGTWAVTAPLVASAAQPNHSPSRSSTSTP